MEVSESKKKGGLEEDKGVMLVSDYNFTMPG
jgi:hypothetical protein